jgi:hypothetical protein
VKLEVNDQGFRGHGVAERASGVLRKSLPENRFFGRHCRAKV